MTFENISSTKTLEAKASTSAKTSANAKTSVKDGGKTNLRTFSFFCSLKSNHRFFPYDIFTVLKCPFTKK